MASVHFAAQSSEKTSYEDEEKKSENMLKFFTSPISDYLDNSLKFLISVADVPSPREAISFRASIMYFRHSSLYKPIFIRPPGFYTSRRTLYPAIGSSMHI